MTYKGLTVGMVAAGALTVLAAAAQGEERHRGSGHDHAMMFETIDADGNGEITLEEMQQHRAQRFDGADTDKDGKLSRAELEAQAAERIAARIDRMISRHDADGDGMLAPDELARPEQSARMFERMDADRSGGISAEEMEQAKSRMRGHMKRRMEQPQDNKG